MHVRPAVSLTATALATLALAACGGSGGATQTTSSTVAVSAPATTPTPATSATTSTGAPTDSSSASSTATSTDSSTPTTSGDAGASGTATASPSATSTSAAAKGSVKGATGSLATYLAGRASAASQQNDCRMTVSVDKRVGGYARGSYFGKGCGGWAATWARVGGSWQEVYAGQDAPQCSVFDAKAPKMPASLGQQCVGTDGKATTYGSATGSDSGTSGTTGSQAAGVVHGGSADLQAFLKGRLATLNKGQSCQYYADVEKQVGSYASGGFSGCGGAAAFWHKSGGTWRTVAETQDVIQCPTLQAKAPGMPTSIVKECYDPTERVVVPWKPAA